MVIAEQATSRIPDRARAGPAGETAPARVAVLSTWHPEPVDNGRKQRTRQMIAALAGEYEVALISLLPPGELAAGALPPVPGVWRQWALPLPTFAPRSLAALLAGLHPLPRSAVMTWRAATAAAIARIARQAGIALAIGTDLRTTRYLLALDPRIGTVLDEPDVSPFTIEAQGEARGLARLRAIGQRGKLRRFLHRAARRLDAAIVASPEEARAYRQLAGPARVEVIENGVAALPDPPWSPPDAAQLLYTGAPSYGPNAEAVAHFARRILPAIEAASPDVHLLVTGALPAALPPGLDHPRVRLAGWLTPRELAAAHRESRAGVVPLLSGTGTRIKLLEALAYGLPVVATAKGAEGLALTPGEHYLRADDPADFAAATLRLLGDAALAGAIGRGGREAVRRRYTWEARGGQLRQLVRDIAARPR